MKVYQKHPNKYANKAKIKPFQSHWSEGLNRRNFIKGSVAISLLASIAGCKPAILTSKTTGDSTDIIRQSKDTVTLDNYSFTHRQHQDLQAVYLHLFPDDGDGPSANDLNVVTYLEWAMSDTKNIADGDGEFIIQGIGWLNQFANDDYGNNFTNLSVDTQHTIIQQTAKSDAGERWLALLIYYLIEALTLDPFYGGNTNQIGWQWLQHQGGFPQPITGKTYRDFT